jgi:hypothetical protein
MRLQMHTETFVATALCQILNVGDICWQILLSRKSVLLFCTDRHGTANRRILHILFASTPERANVNTYPVFSCAMCNYGTVCLVADIFNCVACQWKAVLSIVFRHTMLYWCKTKGCFSIDKNSKMFRIFPWQCLIAIFCSFTLPCCTVTRH